MKLEGREKFRDKLCRDLSKRMGKRQNHQEAGAEWQERGVEGGPGEVAVYSKMSLELPLGMEMMHAIDPRGKTGVFLFVCFVLC